MSHLILRSQHQNRPMPVLATQAYRPGTRELWFGKDGGLNAGSKEEAINNLARLVAEVASGSVTLGQPEAQPETASLVDAKRKSIVEAYRDYSTNRWAETGQAIGVHLYEVSAREGFMRRLLARGEVTMGSLVRARVSWANVTAIAAASASENRAMFVRDRYLYPPEFYITTNVRVEEREIVQGAGDLMDDVFQRSLESVMVQEDRIYKRLLDATVGLANPQQILAGGLTPNSLAELRSQITQWNLSPETILMASNLWSDIVGNAAAFSNLFDPVTQFEIIQTGYLGTLLGLSIITDAFREPNQKVLDSGEIYIIASPSTHGAYTDRGPVASRPVDQYMDGVPARGWFFSEIMSMTIHNPRSVVKGLRA